MSQRASDEPLTNPEQDLLGLAVHAETLARLVRTVPTPFTIGVHGDWGAGKTTFVNFLKHYLVSSATAMPTMRFLAFDAWLYKTADELWRALVLDIARALYDVPEDTDAVEIPRQAKPAAWHDVFARDAIVFRDGPPAPTPQSNFDDLAAFLDQAMYGGIGKSGASALRLDQEDAVTAAVKAGVSALGAISPLVGGLRALLGLGDGEGAQRADREKNEATRNRIESIARFERIFARIVVDKGYAGSTSTRRLCIFVDNLDRCMPDVALDLLDAIKIFLKNAQFVFILAADERLIGQGLDIRYKTASNDDVTTRGQQYLEKLVQLRIHIPESTQDRMHRFVAAQFPEWMPATDIVYLTVGSNPRRLKQFCNWLSFRYAVDCPAEPRHVSKIALLEKLISLHWHDEACLTRIAALAETETYHETMSELEQQVLDLGEDPSREAIEQRVPGADARALVEQITGSHPLYALVTSGERFSQFGPTAVATLASIADLWPHPDLMLEATDRMFMRVLQQLSTDVSLIDKLLLEDFTRLYRLASEYPTLLACAEALARACPDALTWTRQTVAVERAMQSGQLPRDSREEAAALVAEARALSPVSPEPTGAARALRESPRLSEMMRDEVIAHADARGDVPGVEKLLDQHVYEHASDVEKARRLAKATLDGLTGAERERLTESLELRRWAAIRCIEMRSFAKLNAVDRRWPTVGRTLRTDFHAVRWLEKQGLQPGEVPKAYESLWNLYTKDEELRRFLALRPLFADIEPRLLQGYVATSRIIAAGAEPAAAAAPYAAVQPKAAEPPLSADYVDLTMEIVAVPGGPTTAGRHELYDVVFRAPGADPIVDRVTVPWGEFDRSLPLLQQLGVVPPVARSLRQTLGVELLEREWDLQAQLRLVGSAMYDAFVRERLRAAFEELLTRGRPYRLLLRAADDLRRLPFETMYSPNHLFLALTQRYSLVRHTPSATASHERPTLTVPIRVLTVLSNPASTAPLNLEGEADILERAMAAPRATGRVSLEFLAREEATLEHLQSRLRSFRPHVLHFVGHGVVQPTNGEGALVLHGSGGDAHFVAAHEVATLLRDCGVRLAVLNGCDTGVARGNDAITGVAGAVVHAGVPAVIALLREIADEAALLFARDFYRSFCEGFSMEAALAEARKALSVHRWDWSAYALFASTPQLGAMSIPPAAVSRQSGAPSA